MLLNYTNKYVNRRLHYDIIANKVAIYSFKGNVLCPININSFDWMLFSFFMAYVNKAYVSMYRQFVYGWTDIPVSI